MLWANYCNCCFILLIVWGFFSQALASFIKEKFCMIYKIFTSLLWHDSKDIRITWINDSQCAYCILFSDTDPSQQDLLWLQYTHTHGLQKSCGGKGAAWPLSKLERGPPENPAWTGFYCFSGHMTSRMVLVYYAQVHHRWLPFKDNKGQNTANYLNEKGVTAQGWNWSQSILGWFSTDFRKMKILSKHLLPQFRVREF